MKIGIFIPCYINQIEPQIGIKTIELLNQLNVQVESTTNTLCCGQAAFNVGFQEEAKKVCSHFVSTHKHFDKIIVPSASCGGFLKNYAPSLFNNNEASFFSEKIIEITDFLINHCNYEAHHVSFPFKVAYHTSCAALREYPVVNFTKQILNQIQNIELVEFTYSETCCGFGGSFSEKFSDLSVSMAKHKIEMLEKANAEYVVSNDSSCLLQLKSLAKELNSPLKFLHLIEILNQK